MSLALSPSPADPTGKAAHAAGIAPALPVKGDSVTRVTQIALLADVCVADTLEVLAQLQLPKDTVVVKQPTDIYWTIWRDEDSAKFIDAFLVDADMPDEYDEAWHDFDDDGSVGSLDTLCGVWLENFGASSPGAADVGAEFAESCYQENAMDDARNASREVGA